MVEEGFPYPSLFLCIVSGLHTSCSSGRFCTRPSLHYPVLRADNPTRCILYLIQDATAESRIGVETWHRTVRGASTGYDDTHKSDGHIKLAHRQRSSNTGYNSWRSERMGGPGPTRGRVSALGFYRAVLRKDSLDSALFTSAAEQNDPGNVRSLGRVGIWSHPNATCNFEEKKRRAVKTSSNGRILPPTPRRLFRFH